MADLIDEIEEAIYMAANDVMRKSLEGDPPLEEQMVILLTTHRMQAEAAMAIAIERAAKLADNGYLSYRPADATATRIRALATINPKKVGTDNASKNHS